MLAMNGAIAELPPASAMSLSLWRQVAAQALQQELRQVQPPQPPPPSPLLLFHLLLPVLVELEATARSPGCDTCFDLC